MAPLAFGGTLPVTRSFDESAVEESFSSALDGGVRGMYMLGENPFLSDPNITKVRKALSTLDFLVVQDIFLTETAYLADVVLPASAFPEKTGTFTNTDRLVQMGRQAIDPPGNAKQELARQRRTAHAERAVGIADEASPNHEARLELDDVFRRRHVDTREIRRRQDASRMRVGRGRRRRRAPHDDLLQRRPGPPARRRSAPAPP